VINLDDEDNLDCDEDVDDDDDQEDLDDDEIYDDEADDPVESAESVTPHALFSSSVDEELMERFQRARNAKRQRDLSDYEEACSAVDTAKRQLVDLESRKSECERIYKQSAESGINGSAAFIDHLLTAYEKNGQ